MSNDTRRLLTILEACNRTGLKEPTIRLKVYRRELEHVKLGRAVRIPEEEIDRLIRENTVPRIA
jgi:excisionase family DNA binding protein